MESCKFLVFVSLAFWNAHVANAIELKDNHFALLDLDSSIAVTGSRSKSINRFRLDIGYEKALPSFFGDKDLYLHASYSLRYGRNASDFTGDAQGASNNDADEYNKVYEIFMGTNLFSLFDIKLGTMDATNDFGAPENGSEFLNGPAGSSPTILGIPAFPTPKLGVVMQTELDYLNFKIGRYPGGTNRLSLGDTFSIAELGLPIRQKGVFRFGFWRHTELERNDATLGTVQDVYGVLEYDFSDNVSGFFQYGTVDPSFSEIKRHWAHGVTVSPTSSGDIFGGIMMSHAKFRNEKEERLYELFLSFPLKKRFSIKPSLTLIRRPFGNNESPEAIIFNVRLNLTL